jgi:arylsulfatase
MRTPSLSRRGFLGLTCASPALLPAARENRPNVVVILVDDMGFSDIACYGGEIPTPNLDRLASGGIRFTQFQNTARCSPSRASLLTGQYPHRVGMGHLDNMVVKDRPGYQGRLADDSITIAEALKAAGYFTAMSGKWHLGQQHGTLPWERGFDRSLNSQAGGIYSPGQKGRENDRIFLNGRPLPLDSPELGGAAWYSTDLWTDFGLRFIDDARKENKPFFLYLAHNAPHFPLMAPKEDIQRLRGKYMAGWDKLRQERYERQIEMGLIDPSWKLSDRPPESPAWDTLSDSDKDRFDLIMAIYAATVYRMDRAIGTLVDGLKQRGVLDNTLILFMSDNGGNAESGPNGRLEGEDYGSPRSTVFLGTNWATLANTPFRRYKHFTHEGGVSTPLIAHWPAGIDKDRNGKFDDQPGHLVDIMPTVLAATGAPYPAEIRGAKSISLAGTSFVPAFSGKKISRKEPIFFMHEGNRAVRSGKWKLVSKWKEPWELYDMNADRTETNNLATAHPGLVKELAAVYDNWAARTNADFWPSPASRPKPPGRTKP